MARTQHYVYGKIDDTPFSLGIAISEPYGSYRFMGQIDLKAKAKLEDYTNYFSGTNWRVHPDWVKIQHSIREGLIRFLRFTAIFVTICRVQSRRKMQF